MASRQNRRVQLMMAPSLFRRLRAFCKERGIGLSEGIRTILADRLGEER